MHKTLLLVGTLASLSLGVAQKPPRSRPHSQAMFEQNPREPDRPRQA
jgi:hypothetical protein